MTACLAANNIKVDDYEDALPILQVLVMTGRAPEYKQTDWAEPYASATTIIAQLKAMGAVHDDA